MNYQYNLTAIEPHKDGGFREIHICDTESLEAMCHEILRYKKKKKKPEVIGSYKQRSGLHNFSRDARFTREILVEEYKNELGQIEEVWETDFDFRGNDDIYVTTECKGWRKFVRDLMEQD
jgi:hypothetical protein